MNCTILENSRMGRCYYLMRVCIAGFNAGCEPGQFMMIRIAGHSHDPLLRRPISVMDWDGNGVMSFVYKLVGRGTRIMSEMQAGTHLDLLGPLGNGYQVPDTPGARLLVAGGVGIPPIFYLAKKLVRTGHHDIHMFIGGQSAGDLILRDDLISLGIVIHAATEDGSSGEKALVTQPFARKLKDLVSGTPMIFSCGPYPMMKRVAEIAAQYGIPAQLSLETHMGCGIGACLGCVIQTREGQKRVCKDGPVFDSRILQYWD